MRDKAVILALAGSAFAALFVPQTAPAAQVTQSETLVEAVSLDNIKAHLTALDTIGPRVPGSSQYDEAAGYVSTRLLRAGYHVAWQPFDYDLWEELVIPELALTQPDSKVFPPYEEEGFATMEYSGSGNVEAPVVLAGGFGCGLDDFSGEFSGNIALVLRGECTFAQKAANAQAAGAAAVIVYNDEARQTAFIGTLGGPGVAIPVVGSSYAAGMELQQLGAEAHLKVEAETRLVEAYNIIAESATGRDDRVVVVGAHLDTVPETTAMNDNGSGSAITLEIALQMATLNIEPVNKVRFCFWSAEESGLIGSQYYVDSLEDQERKKIALNLNFDMVASPNYVRFVYDGDGSATPDAGPNGSGNIERVFGMYFDGAGLPYEETAFDGRSDYGPFIEAGIPAGGLFAGADELKTVEQAAIFGGTAGAMLDPNYHTPDDNLDNVNSLALQEMSGAAAHAVLNFAMTKSAVNGTAKAQPVAKGKLTYRGPNAQR